MRSIIISPVLKCGNWRQFFFFFLFAYNALTLSRLSSSTVISRRKPRKQNNREIESPNARLTAQSYPRLA